MVLPIAPLPPVDPVSATIDGIVAIGAAILGLRGGVKNALQDLRTIGQYLLDIIKGPIGYLASVIRDYIPALLGRIKRLVELLRKKIAAILGPIIAQAKRQMKMWDDIFKHYIAPILNTIQHLRQTLTIFRVFHLKFADAIDKRLAEIEGRIAGTFLKYKRELNAVISWYQLITDLDGFVKFGAIWKGLHESLNGIGALIRGFAWPKADPTMFVNRDRNIHDITEAGQQESIHRIFSGTERADELEFKRQLEALF